MDAAGERRGGREARRRVRPARERRLGRRRALPRRRVRASAFAARSSSGSRTTARSTTCRLRPGIDAPRDPVGRGPLDEGTGIVHIAPGRGAEDFELSQRARPPRARADRRGRPLLPRATASSRGAATDEVESRSIVDLERARPASSSTARSRTATRLLALRDAARLPHRPTTGSSPPTRSAQPMLEANAAVEWTPGFYGEADGRLAAQHGRLEHLAQALLRPAAAVLPVHVRAPERVGSLAELRERATARARPARGAPPPVDRRGDDPRARHAARDVRRIPRSATPGSTPASFRSRRSAGRTPEWREGGYATGAVRGLTGADLPDHAYWEQWFPADWVSEMREQIRLWFYSQLFMSVTLDGPGAVHGACSTYEKLLDETGREMHSRGERDRRRRGARAHGRRRDALACTASSVPSQNLRFGYGPADGDQAAAADALELGLASSSRTRTSRASGPTTPTSSRAARRASCSRSTAGSSRARNGSSPRRRPTYEALLDARDRRAPSRRFVDDLSNWYIRRSRRRFYEYDDAAFRTLWYALVQALRVISPVMPFLAEHLWRNLVAERVRGRAGVRLPRRLAGARHEADDELLAEMREARRVVELGRQRARRAGSSSASRSAASSSRAPSAPSGHVEEIARGAAREGGRVRRGRGDGAAREAEPAGARAEARARSWGAVRAALAGGRLRGARRAAAFARPGTSSSRTRCSSSARARGLGRRRGRRGDGSARHRRRRSSSSRAARSTSSTG